jgi:uncharacterized membrane protein
MFNPLDHPVLVLVLTLPTFWISAIIGSSFRKGQQELEGEGHDDWNLLLGASLTMLGLIIGFTFSMAVSRYDQRKNLEEEEANAIGTEYVRAGLLPAPDAARVQTLLKRYLSLRIRIYHPSAASETQEIDTQTAKLQSEMWSAVATHATAQPTPVAALILSGMNDVLNSQGYTHAAWRNRIPTGAWILVVAISIFCNLLVGYSARSRSIILFLILPIGLSVALFLIADIDAPRHGVIRVRPQNLESLAKSLQSQ